jgi:hypothetical protein
MWWLLLLVVAVVAYLVFRDTMNKIQYIQTLRIYWITRDDGVIGTPWVTRAFMRQTASPWWNGQGVQLRVGRYTFQCGVLTHRGFDLLDQLEGRYMDEEPKSIRNWK